MDNFVLLCDPCNRLNSNNLTLTELQVAHVDESRMNWEWWEKRGRWR